jgi:hypothetical protein
VPRKNPTAKPGFPCKPEDCYAIRHMTPREFTIYDVMFAFAFAARKGREGNDAEGPLIFKASIEPTLANALNCSADTINETIPRLLNAGWLKLIEEPRKPDGTRAPNVYEVVEHETFAQIHPGDCPLYTYCPDFETAEAHGIKIGDKLGEKGTAPDHFRDANVSSMLRSHQRTLSVSEQEMGWLVSDAVPEKPGTVKPYAVPRDSAQPFRKTPVSRSENSSQAIPGDPGRSLVPSVLEIQTTTTTTPVPRSGAGGGLLKTLAAMWLKKHDTTPEPTPTNLKDLAALEETHGAELVKKAFAVFVKEPSKYKQETTHPFSQFIRGFETYLAKIDRQAAKSSEADAKKMEYDRATKHGNRNYRIGNLRAEFIGTLTDEQRQLVGRCKMDYWLKLTDIEEAALKAIFELNEKPQKKFNPDDI